MPIISLKTKITATVTLIIALLMSLGAYTGLSYFERQFKEFIFGQQYALVSTMADEVDGKIATFQNELVTVARKISPDILSDAEKAGRFMDGHEDTRQIFDNGFFILLPSGRILAGTPIEPAMRTTDYSFREYFRRTMQTKRPFISEPYFSTQSHHHPVVMFTAPVFDSQGKVAAFLGGSIDLMKGNFLGKLASAKIGKSGYFYLFNDARKLIVHPNRARILRDPVKPGANRLLDEALKGFEGAGETVTSWGVPMVSSFKRLKTTGWILAASYPQADAYATINRARQFVPIIAEAALLVSVLAVWLVMNHLTAPLLRFTEHVKGLSRREGEKFAPIEIGTRDEIGELAAVFNQMMAELGARKENMRKTLSLLNATLESTADGILVRNLEGEVIIFNKRFAEMWRFPEAVLATRDDRLMRSAIMDQLKDPERFLEITERLYVRPEVETSDMLEFKDGRVVERVSRPQFVDNEIVGRVISFRDVTEQKKLEHQLRHAQKMEALGTLSGGIAHDFNNILTAIIGYTNLMQMKMDSADPLQHLLAHVISAADRAASLTKSLLAYSRKEPINPMPADVNDIVRKVEKLLVRLIGEDVELVTVLTDDRLTVLADSVQIEQVLMNLAANARDALLDGGRLVIGTQTIELDAEFIRRHGYGTKGRYAQISVSDTGIGMDEKTRERIFEPFFTTKETGKGTGLGLSIVYGIVKQHNGFVDVYSEPGRGATFRIYLPLIGVGAVATPVEHAVSRQRGGTETVLLVEDNHDVRRLVKDVLTEHGYRVIEAVDGEDGVEKFRVHEAEVALLITDVVMPKKNGRQVHEEIRQLRGDVRTIFMSGHTAEIIDRREVLEKGLDFLQKPIMPEKLLAKVREVLDREEG